MVLTLHGTRMNPSERAILLTLHALELDYEFRQVDMPAGYDQLPTVPTLEDGDAAIWESHAIIGYLVQKYAKDGDDALYPREPLQRAIVDQRLHYESGVLFVAFKELQHLLFTENITELPKDLIDQLHETYAVLEQFLVDQAYLAGQQLTIADFSIVSTLSSLHLSYAPIDPTEYPNLSAWLARISSLPYYEEANLQGARLLADQVRAKLPKQFDKLWQKAFADIKSGAVKL
ncbi:glutathione S-transferase 1 [Drosophila grimshawi]|uniref:GH20218 n=1 Tax=Drosophila grimshawi TaxID=7222 RepID=B4J5S9_DROGR|nr:glutathione S-transferase 1 [Drosophila grimshawi]EDW01855.1 GH20218 [Drosophila grimshawi]